MELVNGEKMNYQEMAEQTYHALLNRFFLKHEGLYLEHYQKKEEDQEVSFLWPYSGVISAINALAKMPSIGKQYYHDLINVLDGLEKYWNEQSKPEAYDSYVIKYGGGQQFYDDNEWLGLDFIEAYHTLGDKKYLQKAKMMFDFAISGWSEDKGGGIYWNTDKKTRNTCSNGPAAVLAIQLYEVTGDMKYLDWAIKILKWTKQLESPNEGIYWDNIREDGSIDQTTYTYNVGTIIHSNALLYKLTNEDIYLIEASRLAESSLEYFLKKKNDLSFAVFPDSPWFNVILFKGYLALYHADPSRNRMYINAIQANVNYAWKHARDENGLFSKDWTGEKGVSQEHKWLLDQAPMIEFYALLTLTELI
ncbi:glycoside hydrolase family 76 protein [Metabacillus sp. FJAT-53654]|jgi:uncharacterized protein YyaL (SSP411 family)